MSGGNKYKLQNSANDYKLRKFSFCSRVVNIWNSLPDSVVDADTHNTFKSRLDKQWLDQDVFLLFLSSFTSFCLTFARLLLAEDAENVFCLSFDVFCRLLPTFAVFWIIKQASITLPRARLPIT